MQHLETTNMLSKWKYNISVISWRSVLLVEETGGPRENHRPVTSHWQTGQIPMHLKVRSQCHFFFLQIRSSLYLCTCWKHKFESRYVIKHVWWGHQILEVGEAFRLSNLCFKQIKCTGKAWGEFKGRIWRCKRIL
jgi:hypothetical protein